MQGCREDGLFDNGDEDALVHTEQFPLSKDVPGFAQAQSLV